MSITVDYVHGGSENLDEWTLDYTETYDDTVEATYYNGDNTFIIATTDNEAGEDIVTFMQISGGREAENLLRIFLYDWLRGESVLDFEQTIIDSFLTTRSVAVSLKDWDENGTTKYHISGEWNLYTV